MSDIPEKIFLHFGANDPQYIGMLSWGDVEWSDEAEGDNDIEYIRYSTYRKREKELMDQIKYLIVENSIQTEE